MKILSVSFDAQLLNRKFFFAGKYHLLINSCTMHPDVAMSIFLKMFSVATNLTLC